MKTMKKVSIVIPCYNDKKYIEESVNSALSQTYGLFEIIIVDDGSDLETKEILRQLQNDRIKLITQENKGLSAARNVGIQKAIGDYILTLDADDFFEPDFLEKAVSILECNNEVGVVTCYCNYFNDKGGILYAYKPAGGDINDFLYKNSAIGNSLFRKQCWIDAGGYDEKMRKGYEDWEFWISVTKNDWKVYVIEEFLFNYRKKENSMLQTTNLFYEEENYKYVLNKHKELYKEDFNKTVDFLLQLSLRYKKNEVKRLNSIDYRLGYTILKPLRFLKKKFTLEIVKQNNCNDFFI